MDKYSPSITQTNETSYRTINYPNINTLSFIQSKNNNKTEKNQKSNCQKLFQLNSHRSTINNNKNNLFDEDDTKNNENFVTFLDNLLNKEDSSKYLKTANFPNEDNSSIHSKKNFFLKKINTKNIKNSSINNNKKEEDIYYSFRDNKIKNKSSSKINNDYLPFQYRLQNFMVSIPKKSRQQIILNNINNNNIDFKNNILQNYNTEKKSIGINCQISDFYLNKQKNDNEDEDIIKLGQNYSLKQIDGTILTKFENLVKSDKKPKKSNNRKKPLNHILKYFPDNNIPKIIFYSRNKVIRDKETEHKLNTMKENVIHFLKDKSNYSLTKKHSNTNNFRNINEKNYLNKNLTIGNIFPFKTSNNPFFIFKLFYGNEKNLISYLKNFDRNYKKKMNKKKLNMNNKKKAFSSLKNTNYYNLNKKFENIKNAK